MLAQSHHVVLLLGAGRFSWGSPGLAYLVLILPPSGLLKGSLTLLSSSPAGTSCNKESDRLIFCIEYLPYFAISLWQRLCRKGLCINLPPFCGDERSAALSLSGRSVNSVAICPWGKSHSWIIRRINSAWRWKIASWSQSMRLILFAANRAVYRRTSWLVEELLQYVPRIFSK